MNCPEAARRPKVLREHGRERQDDYFWLRERDNPEVIEYIKAENDYAAEFMAGKQYLIREIRGEIISRIQRDDMTTPVLDNGYWYYQRFAGESEYPVHCRRKMTMTAAEEIILDVNKIAAGRAYCRAGGLAVSPDNRLLAYGVDFTGDRVYLIRIVDLKTGATLPYKAAGTDGATTWANDSQTLFHVLRNETTLRAETVIRRDIAGKEQSTVHHEPDEAFDLGIWKSKSDAFIVIDCESNRTTESWILDAHHPKGEFRLVQRRINGLEYSVEHRGGQLYILTNHQALDFRLMKTSLTATGIDNWVEFIPHQPGRQIEDFDVFDEFIAIERRINGIPAIQIHDWNGKLLRTVDFDDDDHTAWLGDNPMMNRNRLRIGYSSLRTPTTIMEVDMTNGERKVLRQIPVPGYNADDYRVERISVKARDGVDIPVSMVMRKDASDKPKPLLLYGYGAYGVNIDSIFRQSRVSLLDRGFVFAVAHIRGGQELGRNWYEQGKLLNKINSFNDFIDCARCLIDNGTTNPERLFAVGASAGGLLMAGVANLAPAGMFKGIIAHVPFVDVINTMLDASLPLTVGEYEEWGNPAEIRFYDYILSYSPYDNVTARDYPAILATTSINDSQVQYWEPLKWTAKLRRHKTDNHPLVLKTDMDCGHAGKSGRFKSADDDAYEYSFIIAALETTTKVNV